LEPLVSSRCRGSNEKRAHTFQNHPYAGVRRSRVTPLWIISVDVSTSNGSVFPPLNPIFFVVRRSCRCLSVPRALRRRGGASRRSPSTSSRAYRTRLAGTPYTLDPAPCTLHPAPCTLHHAPYTLHTTYGSWDGIANQNLFRTCPVPSFGHAGTNIRT
jgi:hypothetical protein